MNLNKRRWLVLAASCLINLCVGSLYAWSVFATPMAERLSALTGTEVTDLAIVFTLANAIAPVSMISGGVFNDRLGPRGAIIFGGLLFGFGMISSGFAVSPAMLLVSYGLGVGLGVSLVYGCIVSNAVKFFPDRQGLAGGLTTASYGMGSVVIPPIANALINIFDVTLAFKLLGAFSAVMVLLLSFFILRCPVGYSPEGWVPPVTERAAHSPDKIWKQMLADPIFFTMLLILCCGAFSGLMVISQASPIAQSMIGMTKAAAAAAVSVLAVFNTFGRFLSGVLSDKIGIVTTLRLFFVLSTAGAVLLACSGQGDSVTFFLGLSAVGLGFGSIMGTFPGFTAAQFGAKNNSVNYGIMFIGFAAAGYFGPTIMSAIYAAQGQYRSAFLIAVLLSVTGLLLTVVYTVQQARRAASARS